MKDKKIFNDYIFKNNSSLKKYLEFTVEAQNLCSLNNLTLMLKEYGFNKRESEFIQNLAISIDEENIFELFEIYQKFDELIYKILNLLMGENYGKNNNN